MKKLLFIFLVCASTLVRGQDNPPSGTYTPILTTGYDELRMRIRALHIPTFGTVPVLQARQWMAAGAVGIDSVGNKFYFWSSGAWHEAGSGGLPYHISNGLNQSFGDTIGLGGVLGYHTMITIPSRYYPGSPNKRLQFGNRSIDSLYNDQNQPNGTRNLQGAVYSDPMILIERNVAERYNDTTALSYGGNIQANTYAHYDSVSTHFDNNLRPINLPYGGINSESQIFPPRDLTGLYHTQYGQHQSALAGSASWGDTWGYSVEVKSNIPWYSYPMGLVLNGDLNRKNAYDRTRSITGYGVALASIDWRGRQGTISPSSIENGSYIGRTFGLQIVGNTSQNISTGGATKAKILLVSTMDTVGGIDIMDMYRPFNETKNGYGILQRGNLDMNHFNGFMSIGTKIPGYNNLNLPKLSVNANSFYQNDTIFKVARNNVGYDLMTDSSGITRAKGIKSFSTFDAFSAYAPVNGFSQYQFYMTDSSKRQAVFGYYNAPSWDNRTALFSVGDTYTFSEYPEASPGMRFEFRTGQSSPTRMAIFRDGHIGMGNSLADIIDPSIRNRYRLAVIGTIYSNDTVFAKTMTAGDNSTAVATTAYVTTALSGVGSGSVTNVASGFGLIGGPITTTGTLKIDSSFVGVLTWAEAKRKFDSLNAANIATYVPLTRTLSANFPLSTSGADLSTNRTFSLDTSWNGVMTEKDTKRKLDSLSVVISGGDALKVNISDTATMLLNYKQGMIANTANILLKKAITDSGRLVSNYVTGGTLNKVRDSLQANIAALGGTVTNVATGYGLMGGPITTTGTLKADTSFVGLMTWVMNKKKIDSLAARITPTTLGGTGLTAFTANSHWFPSSTSAIGQLSNASGVDKFVRYPASSATPTMDTLINTDATGAANDYVATWQGGTVFFQEPDETPYFVRQDRYIGGTALAMSGDPSSASGSLTLVDNRCYLSSSLVGKARTITGVKFFIKTNGSYTADQTNSVALYSINPATGLLTKIAETANSGTLYTAGANTWVNIAFATPVDVTKGTYFASFIWNASATTIAPIIKCHNWGAKEEGLMDLGVPGSLYFGAVLAQNSQPSTIASGSFVQSSAGQAFFILY